MLDAVLQLVADAQEIDLRAWEDGDCARPRSELLERVRDLLARGIDLLDEALGAGSAEGLADLAFVARGELRTRLASLPTRTVAASSTREDPARILALAGSCLRKLVRAFTAIEAQLAEEAGRPPVLSLAGELRTSLAVRRAYVDFRRRMAGADPANATAVRDTLRQAADGIATLLGLEICRDFRIQDRVELRRLKERLLAWHRGEAKTERGLQLWQEVLAVAHLLAAVNHRQELAEHDRQILATVGQKLRGLPAFSPVPAPLRGLLAPLYGRDDELDALAARPEVTAAALLVRLDALQRQLAPASAGAAMASEDSSDAIALYRPRST